MDADHSRLTYYIYIIQLSIQKRFIVKQYKYRLSEVNYWVRVRVMVLNATFNNIQLYRGGQFHRTENMVRAM